MSSIIDNSWPSVNYIRKIEQNPGSVMSCFMLEAIQAVALVMGSGKTAAPEPMQTTSESIIQREQISKDHKAIKRDDLEQQFQPDTILEQTINSQVELFF